MLSDLKLLAGRTLVHVHADVRPGPAYEAVTSDLEDVYFSTMAGLIGRRAESRVLETVS